MLKPTTQTLFAIARDADLISDGYTNIDTAKQQLAHFQDTMRSVGLEPDVTIVTVEAKTTLGKPKIWAETITHPEPTEAIKDAPTGEVEDTPPAEPLK